MNTPTANAAALKKPIFSKGQRTSQTGQRGLAALKTLFLLMIVVAASSWAISSASARQLTASMQSLSDLITLDVTRAQREAMRRGRTVVICPTQDGDACSSAGDWAQGWLLLEEYRGAQAVIGYRVATVPDELTISGPSQIRFNERGQRVDGRDALVFSNARCPDVADVWLLIARDGEVVRQPMQCQRAMAINPLLTMQE